MFYKYKDDFKFVYNFHSYNPMFVWPHTDSELKLNHPEAYRIFNEIWDEGEFPAMTIGGNAKHT